MWRVAAAPLITHHLVYSSLLSHKQVPAPCIVLTRSRFCFRAVVWWHLNRFRSIGADCIFLLPGLSVVAWLSLLGLSPEIVGAIYSLALVPVLCRSLCCSVARYIWYAFGVFEAPEFWCRLGYFFYLRLKRHLKANQNRYVGV